MVGSSRDKASRRDATALFSSMGKLNSKAKFNPSNSPDDSQSPNGIEASAHREMKVMVFYSGILEKHSSKSSGAIWYSAVRVESGCKVRGKTQVGRVGSLSFRGI
ncbi:hypothetical protein MAP00_002795 [Monascus purpureus]|nr:hypothetical protein MAP00_002795 [Monascus purpureus]